MNGAGIRAAHRRTSTWKLASAALDHAARASARQEQGGGPYQ